MSKENSQYAKEILDRVKFFLKLRTDTELASVLEIKSNTLSTWKKRGKVDLAALFSACEGANLNWLLYGTGTMRAGQLDPVTGRVVAMLETMDKEQRRDVLRFTEKEQLICELQHEREQRKKAV